MNLDTEMVTTLALTIPCARCEAKVNDRCASITGGKAGLHAARSEVIYRAYGLGYADGVAETTRTFDEALLNG